MSGPELATAFAAGMIGVALGVALMAWDAYRAERTKPKAADEALTRQHTQLANLQASLDAVGEERDDLLSTLQAVRLTLDKYARAP